MIAPSALLFPYTDLTPVRLTRGLFFFKEIILYSLPRSHPDDFMARAVEKGLVRPRPVSFIEDENEIKRILDDFAGWAQSYGDGGYMSMLRHHLSQENSESSGARLMSAIRGKWTDPGLQQDPQRQAQILLHFAQALDRQRYETNLLLSEVADEEERLGEIMGVEPFDTAMDGDEAVVHGTEPLPISDEAGLDLMPQRLTAWFRLLEAFGHDGAFLFTDQPAAIEALDLNLARQRPARKEIESQRLTEILEPFMTVTVPAPEPGCGTPDLADPAGPGNLWPGWPDFLEKVASRPWTAQELDKLRQEAEELTAAPAPAPDEHSLTLTGYLLPGTDLIAAMREAVDLTRGAGPDEVFCGPILALQSRSS